MIRTGWKNAVLCGTFVAGACVPMWAQNATSGGDQQPQPDAQNIASQRGGGGRRGGGIRGTATAVSGTSVTLKTEAGESWTVIGTDNTRIRRDGQPAALSAIQPGDEVMAMGMPDADKHEVHAMMVMDVSAAEVARAKANLGKTYIVGRITAINDTQITVMRNDKVSQVITLDETTSLHRGGRPDPQAMAAAGLDMGMMGGMRGGMGGRRGSVAAPDAPDANGEAITLADVKAGDTVVGTGAVKGGSFVPTDLHVIQRPVGGGRRGPGGDAPPQP